MKFTKFQHDLYDLIKKLQRNILDNLLFFPQQLNLCVVEFEQAYKIASNKRLGKETLILGKD